MTEELTVDLAMSQRFELVEKIAIIQGRHKAELEPLLEVVNLCEQFIKDEMTKGTLWGIPFDSSTHIVRNEGAGEDESMLYLTDMDEMMLGQGQNLQVDMSSEATFVDADGNVVSAFQRNWGAV